MSGAGWKAFRLVPDDVLFFRDGKPSSRGDDHYLRSLFPPLPSTLYGALRTRRLLDEGVSLAGLDASTWNERLGALASELGPWGGFGSLELRGPWLVRERTPGKLETLLAAPLDLALVLQETVEGAQRPEILRVLRYASPDPRPSGTWSHPLDLLTLSEPDATAPHDWFLTPQGLSAWTSGKAPSPEHFVHASDLWSTELRTGVGLEKRRRTSEEGLLYTFGFIRLRQGVSLGFEVRGTALAEGANAGNGWLRLGGEGRTMRLEDGPALPVPAAPQAERFRLAFFTPALSTTGAYPPGFAATGREGSLAGRTCTLQSAVCRGPLAVGGWDLASHRPKPLRRAIPAGSVYLFESPDSSLPTAVHGHCLNDFSADHFSRQGFGLALAARDA